MTLWAVNVVGPQVPSQYWPADDRDTADESVGRINAWVADMQDRHPDLGLDITAEVIEWPGDAEQHAESLAELRRRAQEMEEAE